MVQPSTSRPRLGPLPEDWLTLHAAVTDRLRRSVHASPPQQNNGAVASRWATVVECVGALDQLHGSLQRASASVTAPTESPQVGEQADEAPAAGFRAVGADQAAPKQP